MSTTDALDPAGTYEFPLPVCPGSPPRTAVARYLSCRQAAEYNRQVNAARNAYIADGESLDAFIEAVQQPIVTVDGRTDFDLGELCTDTGLIGLAMVMREYASTAEIDRKKSESPSPGGAAKEDSVANAPEANA